MPLNTNLTFCMYCVHTEFRQVYTPLEWPVQVGSFFCGFSSKTRLKRVCQCFVHRYTVQSNVCTQKSENATGKLPTCPDHSKGVYTCLKCGCGAVQPETCLYYVHTHIYNHERVCTMYIHNLTFINLYVHTVYIHIYSCTCTYTFML